MGHLNLSTACYQFSSQERFDQNFSASWQVAALLQNWTYGHFLTVKPRLQSFFK